MAFHHVMLVHDEEKICYDCFSSPPLTSILSPPSLIPQGSHHLSLKVIIIVGILAAAFLSVSCYILIVKFGFSWIISRRAAPQSSNTPDEVDDDDDDDDDESQNPIHHIWYITTVGLEESVINSIAVCKYKRGGGLIDGTECSVCLSEFREGENVRLLPKCCHAFHVPCIDTWLRSHVNCPLCRAGVVPNAASASSTNPNPDSSDAVDETQMENSEIDVPLERNQSGRIENGRQGEEAESDADDGIVDIETGKDVSFPPANCGFRAQSDLSDNRRSGERHVELRENERQPVPRSVSMNSLFPIDSEGSSSAIAEQPIANKKSNSDEFSRQKKIARNRNRNQSMSKMVGNYSKGAFLQKGPVSMKRSLSAGGNFLLPRSGRSRNSILPL